MEVSDLYVCSYSMNRSLYRQVGHGRGDFKEKTIAATEQWPSTFNYLSMRKHCILLF